MNPLLTLVLLLLFPAGALVAWRATGSARLWSVTGIEFCAIELFAVFKAISLGGSFSPGDYGYGAAVSQWLVLDGLTFGSSLLATAVTIQALAGRLSSRFGLYATGVLCAGLGWVLGFLAIIQIATGDLIPILGQSLVFTPHSSCARRGRP